VNADIRSLIILDFDPEDEPEDESEEGSEGSDDDQDAHAGRDHYVDVGKSKIRKPQETSLGPQYAGSRVGRNAMADDEDDDDPFNRGFNDEDSDEEVPGRANEIDDDDDDDEEDESIQGNEDEEDEEDVSSMTDMSEDGEDDDRRHETKPAEVDTDRAELRRMMAEEQKSVSATLSQAAKADAEKGRAVKKQRATFDSLLNIRIKLQKALVGTNTLIGLAHTEDTAKPDTSEPAFRAAETAAFKLWQSLTSLRDSLSDARTGTKRKHSTFSVDTPTHALWSYTQSQGRANQADRTATLEKWSAKARGAAAITPRNRLNQSASTTITDVLNEQFSQSERLIKRARTPRSCAPYQLTHRPSAEEERYIYDDADFYGTLLQTLLEQRSADSASATVAGGIDIKSGYQMRREAKTKKLVDVKASKGRKLKYTVHEKLQNFMAPEDRGTWGERQIDELFGSLFGARMGLGEDEEVDLDEVDGHVETEGSTDEGLMLFRR